MRALVFFCLLTATVATVTEAQALGGNEYAAGAALNLAARAPFIATAWRRPVPRFLLAQSVSLAYERFVDVHTWGALGHKPWADVGGRLAGYLLTEVAVFAVRRIAR